MKAENLPFADGEFDMASAIEVLEHVPDPEHTVAEMARVAGRWLLVSVPREPLWRGLNMARGAYLRDLGNTPGHLNHWSKRSFVALLSAPRRGRRGALAVPLDDAPRPPAWLAPPRPRAATGGYGRGARILSIGIASTGLFSFAVLRGRQPRARARASTARSRCCGRSCSSSPRSSTARSSSCCRARSPSGSRAGRPAAHPLRVPLTLQAALRGWRSSSSCSSPRGPDRRTPSTARRRCTGSSSAAGVAYAASYFARGYLAGHRWFALYGGLVLFEAVGRFCFPVAVAVGLASGQTAVALGIAAAPLLSLLVVPAALARHAGARAAAARGARRELTLRAGAGFAVAVAAIQLAEQTLVNAAVLTTRATAGTVAGRRRVQRAAHHARAAAALPGRPDLAAAPPHRPAHDRGRRRLRARDPRHAAGRRRLRRPRSRSACWRIGPWAMDLVFGDDYAYGRWGLAVIARRHGLPPGGGHAQPGRAGPRPRPPRAAVAWLAAAALFVAWMVVPAIDDELLRAEVGYAAATALLCAALWRLYRRAGSRAAAWRAGGHGGRQLRPARALGSDRRSVPHAPACSAPACT